MFRNYLKVAFRNILKHKGYSLINVAGLTIGLACCLVIAIWVLDELSYDKFHENAPSLYRVEENQYYTGRVFHVTVTPYPLGPALVQEIPEIKDATRYVWSGGLLFRYGEQAFFEDDIRAVDQSFLQMFTFPLIKGNPETALSSPFSLVVSESIAEKYFGNEDALGRTISVNNQHEFTVTGVLKNVPHNSHLQFEILIPYAILEKQGRTSDSFGSNSIGTYVQLEKYATMEGVNPKIKGFIKSRVPESATDLELMAFTRIHLHSYFGYEKDPGGIQYVYIFSIIALFVLIIACINFMNLSTARSANRAKEVGMRKVVGASKSNLIRQFYGESLVLTMISLVFAVILVTAVLPFLSSLAGKDLSWNVTGMGTILLGLMAVTLFTSLVAGSYPALFLSGFQPVRVIKGALKSGAGSSRFRKILVVVQFSLSVLLLIGTAVVYKQLNYMKNKRLGWDKEHIITVPLRADTRDSYEVLKSELLKDSLILGITGTREMPTYIGSNSSNADWEGKDPDFSMLIGQNTVDFDFVDTLKIEIVEGRSFSREYPTDPTSAFLVNEEVARIMEKESVVGERFRFMGTEGKIIGVMKNFHYQPLQNKIEPLALMVSPERINYALVRLNPEDISDSIKSLESTWEKIIPSCPFEFRFLDEIFDRMYRTEERMGSLLKYFAFLAVFVACLGLFGLASFTAEQRTKEIGIRKVLGATVSQVTSLLCQEFILLVLLANLIAWPIAYLLMRNWLENYGYRTSLNLIIFLGALLLAVIVAIFSVGFQAVRAAKSNPATALKYE